MKRGGRGRSMRRSDSEHPVSSSEYSGPCGLSSFADSYHRIKETLRRKFADLANAFEQRLHGIDRELADIEGPLEEQQQQVQAVQLRMGTLGELGRLLLRAKL